MMPTPRMFLFACLATGLFIGLLLHNLFAPIFRDLNDESDEALDEAGTAARIAALERRVFKCEVRRFEPPAAPVKVHRFPKKKPASKS